MTKAKSRTTAVRTPARPAANVAPARHAPDAPAAAPATAAAPRAEAAGARRPHRQRLWAAVKPLIITLLVAAAALATALAGLGHGRPAGGVLLLGGALALIVIGAAARARGAAPAYAASHPAAGPARVADHPPSTERRLAAIRLTADSFAETEIDFFVEGETLHHERHDDSEHGGGQRAVSRGPRHRALPARGPL